MVRSISSHELGPSVAYVPLRRGPHENYARAWLITWKTINHLSCFQRRRSKVVSIGAFIHYTLVASLAVSASVHTSSWESALPSAHQASHVVSSTCDFNLPR